MQHLPILKICSCPCQAGPNGAGRVFLTNQNGYGLARQTLGAVQSFPQIGQKRMPFSSFLPQFVQYRSCSSFAPQAEQNWLSSLWTALPQFGQNLPGAFGGTGAPVLLV